MALEGPVIFGFDLIFAILGFMLRHPKVTLTLVVLTVAYAHCSAAGVAPVDPNTVYSQDQMTRALVLSMTVEQAQTGAAIGEAESGGRAGSIANTGRPDRYGYHLPAAGATPEYSVGPWQINLLAHPDVSVNCAMDLSCAADAVARISAHGTNWSAWTTYRTGAYRQFEGT